MAAGYYTDSGGTFGIGPFQVCPQPGGVRSQQSETKPRPGPAAGPPDSSINRFPEGKKLPGEWGAFLGRFPRPQRNAQLFALWLGPFG